MEILTAQGKLAEKNQQNITPCGAYSTYDAWHFLGVGYPWVELGLVGGDIGGDEE